MKMNGQRDIFLHECRMTDIIRAVTGNNSLHFDMKKPVELSRMVQMQAKSRKRKRI